jgi:hypothetical protein
VSDHSEDYLGTREEYERALRDARRRPFRTVMKIFVLIGAIFLALSLFLAVTGLLGGWIGAGKDIVSPTNVKEQHRAVIEEYEALRAAAVNACNAANAADIDATLVEDPAFAYKAQYERISISYNRRQKNLFEADLVGPRGYPDEAPPLRAMQARFCE